MKPCEDCGGDNWRFRKDGEATVATCNDCHNEIRFTSKKSSSTKIECPQCQSTMEHVKDPFITEKMNLPFYYDYIFKCPKCEFSYPDEKSKRINII